MKNPPILMILTCCFATAYPLFAQQTEGDTLKTNELAPVTVTAYRVEMSDMATPLSMTRIGEKQLQTGAQQLGLDEALMNVPGLFVQNGTNFAQDIRVSIRGFGARSAFGIRGVKILVDGFPESTPDGTAQVDAIDPSSLTGLTVIRSGTGGLYGNASGGSINFNTMKFNDEEWGEAGVTVGSYGYQKSQIKMGGGKANKFLYSLNGAFTSLDGYREHNAMKNYLVNGGFLIPIDSTMTIRGVLTYVNSPLAQDPGGLDEEDLKEDRRMANNAFEFDDVGEKLWQLRAGIAVSKDLNKSHRLKASFFQTNRSFESFLVNDAVKLQRSFTGGTFNYEYRTKPGHLNWSLNLGADLENQADDRKRFDNDGNGFEDQYAYLTESYASAGFYAIQKLEFNEQVYLLASLRYDRIFINVDDKFPDNINADDYKDDFAALNPTLGFSVTPSEYATIFFNYGSNFETPTLLELSQAGDEGLKPQTTKSAELGIRVLSEEQKIKVEIALFRMNLKDEIIRVTENFGNNLFRNVGSSTRMGVELSMNGKMAKHLAFSMNANFYDFEFEDYDTYDRNKMPGQPRYMAGFMFSNSRIKHLMLTAGGNWVGSIYADFDNRESVDDYFFGYFRAAYDFKFKENVLELYSGINNLFNERYNANVRINNSKPFEPAPLRNFYTGLKIRF
ncbi:MAG: TonB-dependent receptor [Saprospiraceae bacterium]|nr:TonB-dependent receptor [Saprospiraceae bacterium]